MVKREKGHLVFISACSMYPFPSYIYLFLLSSFFFLLPFLWVGITRGRLLKVMEPLGALRARDGVYMVTGNHEHLHPPLSPTLEALEHLNITILRNSRITLPRPPSSYNKAMGKPLPSWTFDVAGVYDWDSERLSKFSVSLLEQAGSRAKSLPEQELEAASRGKQSDGKTQPIKADLKAALAGKSTTHFGRIPLLQAAVSLCISLSISSAPKQWTLELNHPMEWFYNLLFSFDS